MVAQASASIGQRLLLARSKREMTMADLGAKAGVSASAINHIEKARGNPSALIVESLAVALSVDPCWSAYGTGTSPDWEEKKAQP